MVEIPLNEEEKNPEGNGPIQLSEAAKAILATMPAEMTPTKLVEGFPRVFNQIATLWKVPRQMDPYLDSLLLDDRCRRQGFPMAVAMEILRLKDYYQTVVYPVRADKWDSIS